MKRVFADSSYFIAVLSRTDAHHERAFQIAINLRDRLVTTHWVIAEVLGYLSSPAIRRSSGAFMRRRRIREALTADHHFAQAGFVPLLAQ